MTKGKYAARAANRLAEIDAGIVAELREKLAAVTAERDAIQADLELARRARASDINRRAIELSEERVARIARLLQDEQSGRDADRIRYSEEVFAVCDKYGVRMAVVAGWAELAEVFGRGSEAGDLINRHGSQKNNRDSRRTSAKQAKHISTLIEQKRLKSSGAAPGAIGVG